MIIKKIKILKSIIKEMRSQNDELIWARVWDDTRNGIDWAQNLPSISPGRWAVGYNYLYIMTRSLLELKPRAVLDIGLGISSTLVSNYFKYNHFDNSVHTIIDHDDKWIDFYTKNHCLSSNSEILQLDCIEKEYCGSKYYAYKNFAEAVKGERYDVVSIDGPWGSERYSRRDIIGQIPEILSDNFVIILDDSNRRGEKDTIAEIEKKLKEADIEYEIGYYAGQTECALITTKNNRFLCSM